MDPGQRIKAIAAEMVSPAEVEALLAQAAAGKRPHAYIGFEPSGTAHVGWMVCANMILALRDAGFEVTILLADWHAKINDKLGGDLEAIRRCGAYMEDVFAALGATGVRFRYASEFAKDDAYWALVVQVAKGTTLARMRRAMTIMGRKEEDSDADVSKFLYPAMQVADIFHMHIDLAYGGLDQRHAHMLARDVAPKLGRKPPAAIHTPLVPSLKGQGRMDATDGIEVKMSKSDPDSGIFLHDAPAVVEKKLKQAHCPAKEIAGNPVWDLLRLVVWPSQHRLAVLRPEKFGGNRIYEAMVEVQADYESGALHPMDLKAAVAAGVNAMLAPVQAYFEKNPDNLQAIMAQKPTR